MIIRVVGLFAWLGPPCPGCRCDHAREDGRLHPPATQTLTRLEWRAVRGEQWHPEPP
jgi:hypothetical protein